MSCEEVSSSPSAQSDCSWSLRHRYHLLPLLFFFFLFFLLLSFFTPDLLLPDPWPHPTFSSSCPSLYPSPSRMSFSFSLFLLFFFLSSIFTDEWQDRFPFMALSKIPSNLSNYDLFQSVNYSLLSSPWCWVRVSTRSLAPRILNTSAVHSWWVDLSVSSWLLSLGQDCNLL